MVRPKKELGQHFLTDRHTAERIVSTLNLDDFKNVLEIGPGKGILTDFLKIRPGINLRLVEIDKESIQFLQDEYQASCPEIFDEDFLKLDFNKVFDNEPFSIIGNFPYNISTQIIFKVLENRNRIEQLVGMLQKEVAERICQKPGTKTYGILSVLVQAYYKTNYAFTVKPGAFFPPPKVNSGVMTMIRKSEDLPTVSYSDLSRVVKMAFNQRRKQLRNSIKPLLPEGFNDPILTKRPEQLSWQEFQTILEKLG